MKVGDVKKFIEEGIEKGSFKGLNPEEYGIRDKSFLSLIDAFCNGASAEQIERIAIGFVMTENLSTSKRVATISMARDVLIGMTKNSYSVEDLKDVLRAYYL